MTEIVNSKYVIAECIISGDKLLNQKIFDLKSSLVSKCNVYSFLLCPNLKTPYAKSITHCTLRSFL